MGIKREKLEGGMDWQVMASRCNLLYTEWISNKVLLYSTENYIQNLMINHNGKKYFKKILMIYKILQKFCIRNFLCIKKKKTRNNLTFQVQNKNYPDCPKERNLTQICLAPASASPSARPAAFLCPCAPVPLCPCAA